MVVPARREHLAALPAVERAAARLFEGHGLPAAVFEAATSSAELHDALDAGLLWVALSPDGAPVGFAIAEPLGGALHLEEIDVHPEHGRRGLGTALVQAVCDHARQRGFAAVTLTTFRDLPWNAPFYERLGFVALDPVPPSLAERMAEEANHGLDPERRVAMARRV